MTLGRVTVELTSADLMGALGKLSEAGVVIQDMGAVEGLSAVFTVSRGQFPLVRRLCEANGCAVRVLRTAGIVRVLRRALKRPLLLSGIMVLLFLTFYLPTRVLLVEVEGESTLDARQILLEAEGCGIGFGARRRDIRSEMVKNRLLEAMPQLQWVGVNTYGCRAVISVRERTVAKPEPEQRGISSLVAVRDGVIREMTVLQGNPVCKVGQSVQQGQVLVSGYTDLGICVRGTVAKGEVFGDTQRSLEVISPAKALKKTAKQGDEKKYSLIFGKFRINFYKGSGISVGSCDKMYAYHYLTLPGGFRLPVALAVEHCVWRDQEETILDRDETALRLSTSAEQYLKGRMIAGRIDDRYEIMTMPGGVYHQVGRYACYEMIGRVRPEEDLGTNEIS